MAREGHLVAVGEVQMGQGRQSGQRGEGGVGEAAAARQLQHAKSLNVSQLL